LPSFMVKEQKEEDARRTARCRGEGGREYCFVPPLRWPGRRKRRREAVGEKVPSHRKEEKEEKRGRAPS